MADRTVLGIQRRVDPHLLNEGKFLEQLAFQPEAKVLALLSSLPLGMVSEIIKANEILVQKKDSAENVAAGLRRVARLYYATSGTFITEVDGEVCVIIGTRAFEAILAVRTGIFTSRSEEAIGCKSLLDRRSHGK